MGRRIQLPKCCFCSKPIDDNRAVARIVDLPNKPYAHDRCYRDSKYANGVAQEELQRRREQA